MAKSSPKSKPVAKKASKAAAKPAKPAKPAPKPAAKPVPKPKAPKVDRGEGSYAVQAKKMRALLDILLEAGTALPEESILKDMAKAGFPVHSRTLAREVERLRVLGYGLERTLLDGVVSYGLVPDPKVLEAFAVLESVRKELRKSGQGPLEKQLAAAIKGLKG